MKKLSKEKTDTLNKCNVIYEIHDNDINKLCFVLEEIAIHIDTKITIGILLINCNKFRIGTPLFIFFSALNKRLENIEIKLISE